MPSLFSRLKGKDSSSKSKKQAHLNGLTDNLPAKPQWEDGWARTTVEAEEVQELIRYCTAELKARGTTEIGPFCETRGRQDPCHNGLDCSVHRLLTRLSTRPALSPLAVPADLEPECGAHFCAQLFP